MDSFYLVRVIRHWLMYTTVYQERVAAISRVASLFTLFHNPKQRPMTDTIQFHHHGRFQVFGGVLPDAVTAYQTYGDVSNPCIVFPTCYGAKLGLGS